MMRWIHGFLALILRRERILCAAIHYDDGRRRHTFQPKNIYSGFVIAGYRHSNVFSFASQLPDGMGKVDHKEQGFLTSKHRFVDRMEALEIARLAGQIVRKTGNQNLLFTEYLY